ncbi:Wound-responsive family protein [Trema orientale]|uniref:Wound-responsive family protein n=1 Tax=Trema orientale TaxID=63057 RepID=A0A2P5F3K7_TREOI|nr:Wound-responsive family protein [Trema orientale]
MSSASRAWIVATSIGVVEALKDQGVCRWNSALRSIQHHTKANLRSYSQAKKISASQYSKNKLEDWKLKQSEESLRTVMYLSCWGPNK